MLNLLQDLWLRMLVIVAVFDYIAWWLSGGQMTEKMIQLFVVEMIAITLSLWYDLKIKKWKKR